MADKKRGIIAKALGVGKKKTSQIKKGIIKPKENAAEMKKRKQAQSKKDTAARNKKVAEAKSNAGKKGFDKHGTKTVAGRKADSTKAMVDKRSAATAARNKAIDEKEAKRVKGVKESRAKDKAKRDSNKVSLKARGAKTVSVGKAKAGSVLGEKKSEKKSKKLSDVAKTKVPTLSGGKSSKMTSGSEKRRKKKESRRNVKAAKLTAKAAQYKKGDKKGERLKRRAQRQKDIGSGKRKTAIGSALKGVAKGYLTGSIAGASSKGKASRAAADKRASAKKSSFDKFTKPNPSKFKPLGGKFKALSLSDQDNKNKE